MHWIAEGLLVMLGQIIDAFIKGNHTGALELCNSHSTRLSIQSIIESTIEVEKFCTLRDNGRSSEADGIASLSLRHVFSSESWFTSIDPMKRVFICIYVGGRRCDIALPLIESIIELSNKYPSALATFILAWCNYASALIKLENAAVLDEYQDYIDLNYSFSPDGRRQSNRKEFRERMLMAAKENLCSARVMGCHFTSDVFPGVVDRLLMVTDILNGDTGNACAVRNPPSLSTATLADLHTMCAHALHSGPDLERVTAIIHEASSRIPGRKLLVLKNIDLDQPEGRQLCKVKTVLNSGTMAMKSTRIIGNQSYNDERTFRFPDMSVYTFNNYFGILDHRGTVMPDRDSLIKQTIDVMGNDFMLLRSLIRGDWLLMSEEWASSITIMSDTHTIIITNHRGWQFQADDNTILVADIVPTLSNYFHWLIDGLPRILASYLDQSDKDLKIVFARSLAPVQIESLRSVGIPVEKIVAVANVAYPIYTTKAMLTISMLSAYNRGADLLSVQPEAINLLRKTLSERHPSSGNPPHRKIFISRSSNNAIRGTINSQEVSNFLRDRGFEEVTLDDMTFGEQMDLFRHAEIAVSPFGATLANIVFMDPGTRVISITGEYMESNCYNQLANIIGIKYITVVCASEALTRPANSLHFTVDLNDLALALSAAA
ncbi:MAG: glycosyltransferase family 61 protein [Rhodospirillaceae bacterium]